MTRHKCKDLTPAQYIFLSKLLLPFIDTLIRGVNDNTRVLDRYRSVRETIEKVMTLNYYSDSDEEVLTEYRGNYIRYIKHRLHEEYGTQ